MIIGAPPEKRGATFGDVPIAASDKDTSALLLADGGRVLLKTSSSTAKPFGGVETIHLRGDHPVTQLLLTPVEPEPKPAAAAYGELERCTRFRWSETLDGLSSLGVCVKVAEGYICEAGEHWSDPPHMPPCPVRVLTPLEVAAHILEAAGVSASVVVHEEPGSLVQVEGNLVLTIGPVSTMDDAEHLVQQLAALLAQRNTSPASEPEVVSAEDRSKPATGFTVGLWGARPWAVTGPLRQLRSTNVPEGEAIAYSWGMHDTQQAGQGGESDG